MNKQKKRVKRILSYILSMALVMSGLMVPGNQAQAATAEAVSDFTITTDGVENTDYAYVDGVLTVLSETPITIANTDPNTATTNKIVVAKDVSANINLAGVNIDVSSTSGACAFKIADNSTGNVTITLADGKANTLKSGSKCAGLQKNGTGDTIGTLTIQGGENSTGCLTATGGTYGAGIGGGSQGASSKITISGGSITATGGSYGAGIGGGQNGAGSEITISGGSITATGGSWGAGIGGGQNGAGSEITISGGSITATGGSYGAGIGGGTKGAGSEITISGGSLTATGGSSGAGIGGGQKGAGSEITISGGTITATGGSLGAGIGGGYEGVGSKITISGGTITATGGNSGAGIGGGQNGAGSEITISGGSVKAVAGRAANNIGGGQNKEAVIPTDGMGNNVYLLKIDNENGDAIKINNTELTPIEHNDEKKVYAYVKGMDYTVQVGMNQAVMYKFIEAAGGFSLLSDENMDFIVTGGSHGTDYAYIELDKTLFILNNKPLTIANKSGMQKATNQIVVAKDVSANITLAGVNIDVSGTLGACAFKIADNSTGNVTITLADGKANTLKSGSKCAGLQKNGTGDTIGTLTIQGGENSTGSLTATGGSYGAGIGGGYEGAGSKITISGGTITATGGSSGAGIGGGQNGAGSKITISGGTVTATGDYYGAGIGGGYEGAGSEIIISGGSVKAVAGTKANHIGGGYKKEAVIPTDGIGNPVYPMIIHNENGDAIKINNTELTMTKHNGEKKVYAYLKGMDCTVQVGTDEAVMYKFVEAAGVFTLLSDENMDFTVTGGSLGTDCAYNKDDETLYIVNNKPLTIANKLGVETTTDKIAVAKNVSANITLAGVNIDVSTTSGACAFKIADNSAGNVTITLADGKTNILKSGMYRAGLQKNGTGDTIGTLTIRGEEKGTGSLTATGGSSGAGIGGGSEGAGSKITISGGTITAKGGSSGAGIGGGSRGASSEITISGGSITATGGSWGAGIGGGNEGAGSKITISGGTITATGGSSGAGIGGGCNGEGSEITINEGTITATGGYSGAGIGGGDNQVGGEDSSYGAGSKITISGGIVIATGGSWGAGIGGGDKGTGSKITISGGTITATGGSSGAGIGGGSGESGEDSCNGEGSEITISGGTITAKGGSSGAGIGGGSSGTASEITISGGSVKAVAGTNANMIGGGQRKEAVIPTDEEGNAVYLMEIDNTAGAMEITINEKEYPVKHSEEDSNVYAYLPAKTGAKPNVVKVGSDTTKYCYDTTNLKWLEVAAIPKADDEVFVCNGTAQTYTLAQSEYYTISDNTTQTDAGTYTVTTTLNDKENTVWSDGTTADKEYTFTIRHVNENSDIICDVCGGYFAATAITEDDCEEMGLSSRYIGYYAISNASNLMWFAKQVNEGNTSLNAVLTENIVVNSGDVLNCNGTKGEGWIDWTPIGDAESNRYTGTFDGNGKTISGLYFNDSSQDYVGLFGGLESGTINNVGIVNSYMNGQNYVGGICGSNLSGTIQDCYTMSMVCGTEEIGGICGNNQGSLQNCYYLGENETDNHEGTTYKTADAFASGEVAYLLNGSTSEGTLLWGQNLKADAYPVFKTDTNTVHFGYRHCYSKEKTYANTELFADIPEHDWKYELDKINSNKITISCATEGCTEGGTVTVTAPINVKYSSVAHEATVTVETTSAEVAIETPEITYTSLTDGVELVDGKPVHVGTYKASITLREVTAYQEFAVEKATPYIVAAPVAKAITYGDTIGVSALSGGVVQHSETDNSIVTGTWKWKEATTKPTIADSGKTEYAMVFTPTDADNYNIVNTKITLTVNKAEVAPYKPENTMSAVYGQKTVAAVELPTDWVWQDADKTKALEVEKAVTATALYNGADKGNYVTESVMITITRQACTHTWDNGVVTKEATTTEAGETTYTCTTCAATKTEDIPMLSTPAPTVTPTATPSVVQPSATPVVSQPSATPAVSQPSATPNMTEPDDTANSVKIGTKFVAGKGSNKATYKVIGNGKVEYMAPISKKVTKITIPATIKANGVTYKVTSIAKNAFKGCKKLKSVTIGKNVSKIGKKAFYGCKKLKNVIIKSKKLTTKKVGSKAFGKNAKKMTVKVPKKKMKVYKKMLVKRGVSRKAKVKK